MELEELFAVYGFTKDEYKFIRYNEKNIKLNNKFIADNLITIYEFFKNKGYDESKIFNFIKYNPEILAYDGEYYQRSWSELVKYGYKEEEIFKMINHKPTILMLSLTEIIIRIESLKKVGYTHKDIKIMSIVTPSIFIQPFDHLTDKIHFIIDNSYTKEQTIYMTSVFSTIFDYSYENIDKRLTLFNELNLHDLAYLKPLLLRQSPNLTYARYKFFQERNIDVNEHKYKKLFMSEKQFIATYKESNKDLIEKYNYDEVIAKNDKKKVLI